MASGDTELRISFDLDDTLRHTQREYDEARQVLGEYLAEEAGLDAETVIETQRRYSRELFDEYGLSKERFPTACVEAYRELVDEADEGAVEDVYEIGKLAFGDERYYRNSGLIEGVESMLDTAMEQAASIHLVTQGDPEIQQRKIDGLGLADWFGDEIYIVDDKQQTLHGFVDEYPDAQWWHVGNSLGSDVEPALDAGMTPVFLPGEAWLDERSDAVEDVVVMESVADVENLLSTYTGQ